MGGLVHGVLVLARDVHGHDDAQEVIPADRADDARTAAGARLEGDLG